MSSTVCMRPVMSQVVHSIIFNQYLRWCILLFLWGFTISPSFASHIVGGEFYLIHKTDTKYELGLNLYYDEISAASPELKQDYIRATIFRKRDNQFMRNVDLGLYKSQSLLTYNNPSCERRDKVRNSRLWYYTEITLSGDTYNDSEGYYVVWERCCRNANITNIYTPNEVGNAFYMEFPAVSLNKQSFINNSPEFGVITGDYACINSPFYFDFSARDADGDSLVYTLVTPYKGYSDACSGRNCVCPDNCPYPADPVQQDRFGNQYIDPDPRNHSAPYPLITWAPGYSLTKSTPGPIPLSVGSRTGIITFTADKQGLYAFAVLCKEYRNGLQIGAVQRDFQISVIECPINNAPIVSLEDNKSNTYVANLSTIEVSTTDSLCFKVALTDKISGTQFGSSTLALTLEAVNFSSSLVSLSPTSGVIYQDSDTVWANLCFEKCAAAEINQPLQVKLVVRDDGCGGGLSDTLIVNFNFEPLVQDSPVILTTLPGNQASIFVRQLLQFNVIATNTGDGAITVNAAGRGFDMRAVGMKFENGKTGVDSVTVPFSWTPDCSVLDVVKDNTFIIDFFTQNKNCKNKYDTTTVTIVVQDSVVDHSYFLPANVFTPNGDEWNPYFEMSNNEDSTKNLPKDNCKERFDRIEMYNRWGRLIFTSHDRNFKWEGAQFPTGSYYFLIYYTTRRYKGWVSLLR
ncbi:gliding motility-associated C-terminal domain-containing protein [Cytophagaceae bacterium YF14B1]|uniref:Gliding motility-associated C-terminal domain-containing protein n=1 Tax=Xanthocytophaga flava TaxID=3048013 RepID=A0AAE3QN30_9BACT|nr:gliding motility-associated C-terminal domain-containing protein [Xanthocytophaga flavus]MDJ1479754.1 gliding motility-associated C-terminal domain-containing protein [Xanthocytophaga flavus]